ncbi:M20/M25/M40 family metallo-hydrolase [Sporomusa aerivorans]|uniref:M20/M25/M40 family metallo-hydrolase n=1 Tax=Sporomusa aerivorans TaxID=204936 RepID=UPI00352B8C10
MKDSVIVKEFLELVKIDVQSRNERGIADVLKDKLTALGLEVSEDDTATKVGGNAGNIIARLKGEPGIPAVLLSAHMDRVMNAGNITPVVHADTGIITSDGNSILAADNIAGVCAILEGIRKIKANNTPHGDIEIVFSVCEEIGVVGTKHLDFKQLQARIAYVFDAPGRIGRIITQAPTKCKIKVGVQGRSAHAGNEPEKGLNAIRVAAVALSRLKEGRISLNTTANFGSFHAGNSTNVVCDYAEILGEARSTNDYEIEQYLQDVKQIFAAVADEYQTEIEVSMQILYRAFSINETEAIAQIAARAMRNVGIEANFTSGGGGMDGNHFNANGIQAIGVALGYSKNHTPAEQVVIADMVKCGELIQELVKEVYRSVNS